MVALNAHTDQQLLDLLRSDDSAALGELYERYYQPLYRFVRKYLHASELSEDICQNVFIRLWDQRKEPQLIRELGAWLFTIAKRLALDFLRRAATEQAALGTILAAYPMNQPVIDQVIEKDYLAFIEKVILTLPEQSQRVFRLCRQQHKTYDEAAAELGISRNTVKKHMMRSMQVLKDAADSELGISFLIVLALLAKK